MSNVIILGDPHIGKNISIGKNSAGSNLNSRIIDQINLLDWTLEQANEQSISDIIITGDIFEEPKPQPHLIALFISWLKRCQVYDINVHVIMGNHDVIRNGMSMFSPLDIISEAELPNVNIYKDIETIIIGNAAFTLIPFRDRKFYSTNSSAEALSFLKNSLVYELAGIPNTYKKVVVGHLAIEGSIPVGDEIDDLVNELFCPIDMFRGYDYVWMGHVHKHQIINKSNPHVAHIGSMDISNFGETDHKKIIIFFDCYDKKSKSWHDATIPTRPMIRVNITVPKEIKDSTEYILKELSKISFQDNSILKIDVSLEDLGAQSINKSAIEKYVINNGVSFVSNITESKKNKVIKRDNNNIIDTKMDTKSAIKTYADLYVEESERSNYIETAMEIYSEFKIESKE